MALAYTQHASGAKQVVCTHCQEVSEVAQRAMSVFCPHCRKRLIIEDYKIKTYKSVRELLTCGDIVVEKRGHVRALIKAGNLTVKGKVYGDVVALGTVDVRKSGYLKGDVEASRLRIETGAELYGFMRIGGHPTA